MKLLFIRDSRSKGYLALLLSDENEKKVLTVSEADFRSLGSPHIGDNLTRDEAELLFISDKRYNARKKALRILSFGDNSEAMLKIKLMRAGIPSDIAAETVSEMQTLGYINAERQLMRIVENLANVSLLGPKRIVPRLISKGYRREDIESAMDELLYRGEIDFSKNEKKLIEKKLPDGCDGEEIKKLLYKFGYSVC